MPASGGFVVRLGPDGLHATMNCARSVTANGVHVFADGYIANAPELRALARAFGREPASSTPGWIALAYEWFGESCSSKLHGQFSAVIADPATGIDGISETDGLDVSSANLGPGFEQGAMIAQDGRNMLPVQNQNFKFVPWSIIAKSLNLEARR